MIRLYCRSRKWAAAVAALCYALLFVIYGLYAVRWAPVLYTALVTLFVLLAAAAADFTVYRRRMEELALLEKRAEHFLGPLPEGQEPMRARYFALAAAVERRRRKDVAAAAAAAKQGRDYYTLWSHQVKTPIAAMSLLLQDEHPDRQAMELELLKMGLLLLVGFLFGGYHFDDQVLISERLSGHHRVKLKNTRVIKVFLLLRDKNQHSYFSTVAVCM